MSSPDFFFFVSLFAYFALIFGGYLEVKGLRTSGPIFVVVNVLLIFSMVSCVAAPPTAFRWNAQAITANLVTAITGYLNVGRAKQKPSQLYTSRSAGWAAKREAFEFWSIPGATSKVLPKSQAGVVKYTPPDAGQSAQWDAYLGNTSADEVGFLDQLVAIMVSNNSFGGNGQRTYFKTDMVTQTNRHPIYFSFPANMTNQEFYVGIRAQYQQNINNLATGSFWNENMVHRIGRLLISWGMPKDFKVQPAGFNAGVHMLIYAWPGGPMVDAHNAANDDFLAKVERDLNKIVAAMTSQKATNKTAGTKATLQMPAGLEFFKGW